MDIELAGVDNCKKVLCASVPPSVSQATSRLSTADARAAGAGRGEMHFESTSRSFTGEESYVIGNKTVASGGYSIADGAGDGLSCELTATARDNIGPFCKTGITSSCPQTK